MTLVNNFFGWTRRHFDKDKVNRFSIIVVMFYYYVGLLSYITVPIPFIYNLFSPNNTVAIVTRAIMAFVVCLYCFLVLVVNRERIKWKWIVLFVYVLVFSFISMLISPRTYKYVYMSSEFNIIHLASASPGMGRLIIMFLTSISDFALAFCFLFIFPIVLNNKKQLLILFIPIIVIGIIECFYSAVVERDKYIRLFQMVDPEYGGYSINIGATFGNKQDWGAFLNTSFIAAVYSFFLIGRGKRKWIVKTFLVTAGLMFFAFSVFSLCKTSLAANIVIAVFAYIIFLVRAFKKNNVLFVVLLAIPTLLLLFIILIFAIPSMHDLPVVGTIYKVIDSYIVKKLFGPTLYERMYIWQKTLENLRTYNLFFGLSKGGVSTYSKIVLIQGQTTLHNGVIYYLLSYGISGFVIYIMLFAIVIKRIIQLFKTHLPLALCSFGTLIAAIIFSLLEGEIFIVSGSITVFIFNILLCSFVEGFNRKGIVYEG